MQIERNDVFGCFLEDIEINNIGNNQPSSAPYARYNEAIRNGTVIGSVLLTRCVLCDSSFYITQDGDVHLSTATCYKLPKYDSAEQGDTLITIQNYFPANDRSS